MTIVEVIGDNLSIKVQGLDKFWALKSRLTIPLSHVRGATIDPGIIKEPRGLRSPGTYVPGVIVAGTYHRDGQRTFWNVRDATKAVVIELADETYQRLVIEVQDPRHTVDVIEASIERVRRQAP